MSIRIGIGLDVFGAGIDADATTIYNRIIADGGVSNLSRLNFFVKGLKAIYGDLANVPVCYDAHWIGYKLGSGTGATAGQAAAKLYSLQGNIQGDAPNKYWVGSGVTNNFCQSNTSTYNTNDIDIEAKAFTSATTGDINFINISNGTSTTVDFFYSKTSNAIAFQYYTGGFRSAFSVTTITDGDVFRVTRNSTTGAVVFKKNGTTITTSGSQVAGVLDFSNTTIKIGQGLCKIYYANFYISGVLNKEFNPNLYTGANTWTSSTSEIWTINSTGAGLADAVQATAASQPLLLSHNGASTDNYWFGSGVSGNYCSCTSLTINYTALDFKSLVTHYDTTLSATATVISQDTNALQIFNTSTTNCVLVISWKDGLGTSRFRTSSSLLISSLANLYIRATVEQVGIDQIAKFYTSTDGITYTLFNTAASIVTTGFLSVTFSPNVGAFSNGSGTSRIKVSRATISNSIGGAPVVDFNPATYNASTSQTQWTSTTGEVWTINTGTAATGYKGVLVDRTIVQGDGVDDHLKSTSSLISQPNSTYSAFLTKYNGVNSSYLFDGLAARQILSISNGVVSPYAGNFATTTATVNMLSLISILFKGASSKISKNNGADSTISIGTSSSSSISLFGEYNGTGSFLNAILNTHIVSNLDYNATTNTAIYNLIRSLNNNAF